MTVFIVHSGEYSDFSIDGIFTSRQKADAYIASKPKHKQSSWTCDAPNVTEIPVDDIPDGWRFWDCVED